MTERVHSLLVVFEQDLREDDVKGLIGALKHLRGVVDVTPCISDVGTAMAEIRADHAWRARLLELVRRKDERGA